MPSSKQKASGGGTGSLVTTAVGVYLGGTHHPNWATALYIVASLSAVYAVLQWGWVQRLLGFQPIYEPDSQAAAAQARLINNTATANGNKIEQHFHGVTTPHFEKDLSKAAKPFLEYPKFTGVFAIPRSQGITTSGARTTDPLAINRSS